MAQTIIAIAALILLPVMAAVNIAALRKAQKACGKRLAKLNSRKSQMLYALMPISALLIVFSLFRDFGAAGAFAICGCGVLGFYLSCREICFNTSASICEHGCILSGGYFLFDDVVEADCSIPNLILITTQSRGKRSFQVFGEAKAEIVKVIKEKSLNA